MTNKPTFYPLFLCTWLVLTLFTCCFSCDNGKGSSTPKILELKTLEVVGDSPSNLNFGVQFETVGTEVIEYGVVYCSDHEAVTHCPDSLLIGHSRTLKFDQPVDTYPMFKGITFPVLNLDCYYRAYAKLSGQRVVYGDIKHKYF